MILQFIKRIVVLLVLTIAPAITQADVLVVPIDVSGSTPVLDQTVLRTAMPIIADRIIKLPVGSRIKVFSVGDDKVKPFEINLYVQRDRTREGDTAKELAKQVPAMIEAKMAQIRANSAHLQGESSLAPAFLDASKWCQSGKPCQIVFLTDGMEYQPGIIAWPTEYKKPLPDIPNLDLNKASVLMYGVGQGAPSFARVAIEQHWKNWLQKHNAGAIELMRL